VTSRCVLVIPLFFIKNLSSFCGVCLKILILLVLILIHNITQILTKLTPLRDRFKSLYNGNVSTIRFASPHFSAVDLLPVKSLNLLVLSELNNASPFLPTSNPDRALFASLSGSEDVAVYKFFSCTLKAVQAVANKDQKADIFVALDSWESVVPKSSPEDFRSDQRLLVRQLCDSFEVSLL
jgi:hypothetical protein